MQYYIRIFIKSLLLTLIFTIGYVIIHGILNHVLFYLIDDFNFSGYLWEQHITILISAYIVYWLLELSYSFEIDKVETKVDALNDSLQSFRENKLTLYPSVTELDIYKIEDDAYNCKFRIHKSYENTTLCDIYGESKEECYQKTFDTIKAVLEK